MSSIYNNVDQELFLTPQDMMPTSMDNPALDEHGNLKDASDMKWYHSEDNEQPLPMPKEKVTTASGLSSKGGSPVLSNLLVNIDKLLCTITQ